MGSNVVTKCSHGKCRHSWHRVREGAASSEHEEARPVDEEGRDPAVRVRGRERVRVRVRGRASFGFGLPER